MGFIPLIYQLDTSLHLFRFYLAIITLEYSFLYRGLIFLLLDLSLGIRF